MISLAYLFAGLFALFGVIFAYRHRRMPGAYPFMMLNAMMCIAAYASNMEYMSTSLEDKLLWRNVQQIPYFLNSVFIFLMAMSYSMYAQYVTRKLPALLILIPSIGLFLIYTNSYHFLMRSSVVLNEHGLLTIERTWLNDLFLFYGFVLSVAGLWILIKTMRSTKGAQKRQLIILVAALSLPMAIALLREVDLFPIRGYGASIAVTYIPTGILFLWAMYKYQLLEIVPIARNKLFEVMKEGIAVLDANRNVLDLNPAAREMMNGTLSSRPGLYEIKLDRQVPFVQKWMEAHESKKETYIEWTVETEEGGRYLSVRVMPITDVRDVFIGSMAVFIDVTDIRRKEHELRRRAVIDSLTGIYNRRGFMEQTERCLSEANREDKPFSLMILDVDFFKVINDEHGHQSGDRVLCVLAETIEGMIGEPHVFGRIGGEEFAIALPGCTASQAHAFADSVRVSIENTLVTLNGQDVRFTVSIGVAARTKTDHSFERLYSKADQSLYIAKQNGRNQTVSL